jgi:hypothetical protein
MECTHRSLKRKSAGRTLLFKLRSTTSGTERVSSIPCVWICRLRPHRCHQSRAFGKISCSLYNVGVVPSGPDLQPLATHNYHKIPEPLQVNCPTVSEGGLTSLRSQLSSLQLKRVLSSVERHLSDVTRQTQLNDSSSLNF